MFINDPTSLRVSATDVQHTDLSEKAYIEEHSGLWEFKANNDPVNIFTNGIKKQCKITEVDLQYTNDILLSSRKKIFWNMNIGLYNLFFERLSVLLMALKNFKDNPILIINDWYVGAEKEYEYYKFFLKSLDDIGIEWIIYNNKQTIFANNSYTINFALVNQESYNLTKEYFKKYIKDINVQPFRKVYLSRKHMPTREYKWIKDGLSCKSDNRLFDHDVLESFLSDNGFEIIIPEEKFNNFEDQINYFYETKLLMSLSSSGIANSIFMKNNTSIIELMTTYPMGLISNFPPADNSVPGIEAIHHLYHTMSYMNNNLYCGIANKTRFSKDIIETINNNDYLKKIIGKEND